MSIPRHLLAGALAAAIGAAAPAAAAPITASEPPDFPDFFFPQSLGTLDIGANTITGGLSYSASGCIAGVGCFVIRGDDEDGFAVMLAAGHRITSISATISDFTPPGGPADARLVPVIAVTTLPIFFNRDITGNGPQQVFTGAVDGAGDLAFGFRTSPKVEGNYGFNYVITVLVEAVPTTTPVPEPATLALFGLGLAGLAAARRRRAR